eukprot:5037054-Pleurochrysis_carterae.AAC.1
MSSITGDTGADESDVGGVGCGCLVRGVVNAVGSTLDLPRGALAAGVGAGAGAGAGCCRRPARAALLPRGFLSSSSPSTSTVDGCTGVRLRFDVRGPTSAAA